MSETRVWCLLGKKAGDNTQVRALAEELGVDYEEKHILAQPWELLTHLALRTTLAGIDRRRSSALSPPWPDLVISAGRRNEPVARWIKRQSGGRARLVHIGRPWAPLAAWDLVVTTPQYFLPRRDNVLHLTLPLHRHSAGQLEEAAGLLRPRITELPRPWIAVLVGGDSGRFVLTPDKAIRLGQLASQLAAGSGGSLLVSDSPRTPLAAGDALHASLQAPHFCYRWRDGGDNPYRALLALADAFVVTGESMSMLGEASAMNRPLFIFDVGDGQRDWRTLSHSYRYKPLSFRLAMRFGPRRMRRDIGNIQRALVAGGRASWLEADSVAASASGLQQLDTNAGSAPGSGGGSLAAEELAQAARAVRRLVTPG